MSSDSDDSDGNDNSPVSHWCVFADDRERAVTTHMHALTDPAKGAGADTRLRVERINIGDYVIMYRERILAAIERKTWKDMAASIKDGRKRNVEKLLELRKNTGCSLIYLIEGKAFPSDKRKVSGVQYKSMMAHLDHLMIRDGISCIRTSNAEHTAKRIFSLVENMKTLGPQFYDAPGHGAAESASGVSGGAGDDGERQHSGGVAQLKKKIKRSDDAVLYGVWASIPWITEKTASLLIDEGKTVRQFLLGEVDRKELAAMRYPSGAIIGNARAKKMLKAADPGSTRIHAAVLRSIPQMGKTTVTRVLDKYSLAELLEDPLKLEFVENGRRVVNSTAVANFIKYMGA